MKQFVCTFVSLILTAVLGAILLQILAASVTVGTPKVEPIEQPVLVEGRRI